MGRFIYGTLFLSVLSVAQSPDPIFVRGTPIEMPFNIRILIQEMKSSFELSGHELTDHVGRQYDAIRCQPPSRRKAHILGNLGDFMQSDYWVCSAQGQHIPITQSLAIKVQAGFIGLDDKSYFRNQLTLVPKNGKIMLVNELGVEDYLAGLVNKEIRSDYPKEAIKAQIIAARSYALATAADLRNNREYFDLYGSELDQVYEGSHFEDARSHRLVKETAGQVLFHLGDVLKAYFHSSNGGFSELPQEVWSGKGSDSRDLKAYLARASESDDRIKIADWQITLSPMMGMRWQNLGPLQNIKVLERSSGRRVKRIMMEGKFGTEEWSGTEFRQKFGLKWIRSTLFGIQKTDKGWLISGKGFGHGVGLSQLGAKQMAHEGRSAREILQFYYPYSSIQKLNLRSLPKNPLRSSLSAR